MKPVRNSVLKQIKDKKNKKDELKSRQEGDEALLHLYLRSTNSSEVKDEVYLIACFASLGGRFLLRTELACLV